MDLLLQVALTNSTCYSMQCNNGRLDMPKNVCTQLENNAIYLQPCGSDYTCQFGFETSYCLPDIEKPSGLSYPGEPCRKTFDCKFGRCKYGYCQGQQQRHACSLSAECAPGLYCSSGICVPQLLAGQSPCSQDSNCVNSAGCLSGTCVSYYSLPVGSQVSKCPSQYSFFCKTGSCWNNICIEAPVTKKSLPVTCTNYTDCPSSLTSNGMIFYSDCVCGNNPTGTSYCSLFAGDDYYSLYTSSVANWLSSEVSGLCNTERRFSFECIKCFWDKPNYQELFLYFFKTTWYPLIQNNDECIMDIYTNVYWGLIEDITYAGNLAFAAVILVISL